LALSFFRTSADVLDSGFRVYRHSLRWYLTITATPFLLLLLPGVLYLSSPSLEPVRPLWVILVGDNPSIIMSGGYALMGALVRDLCFVDGVLWWSVMAGVFAARSVTSSPNACGRRQHQRWMFLPSLKLAAVIALPTLLLRVLNLGIPADLVRIPSLFTALIVMREQQPLHCAVQRSYAIVRQHWLQVVVLFAFLLILLRLVEVTPAAILFVVQLWRPILAETLYAHGQLYVALFAFVSQLAIAPIAHISIEQVYATSAQLCQ
jgi:hypothetical protein